MSTTTAVLLVGHGTIANVSDLPDFLLRIRRGRPASPALVAELTHRYEKIGGSPLLDVTRGLGKELAVRLGLPVFVAMRFSAPFVEDVLEEIAAAGVSELVVLPVAPFSVQIYAGAVKEAQASRSPGVARIALRPVEPYGEDPAFVAAHADKIRPALDGRDRERTALVLTAHSLPTRVIASGDTYQIEFERSAHRIADVLGWDATIAYQSQGADGGDWLGPDLLQTLTSLRAAGKAHVVVAPVGFVADHIETLYDLDVEARTRADALGLSFTRIPSLNAEPAFADVLANLVRGALGRAP